MAKIPYPSALLAGSPRTGIPENAIVDFEKDTKQVISLKFDLLCEYLRNGIVSFEDFVKERDRIFNHIK